MNCQIWPEKPFWHQDVDLGGGVNLRIYGLTSTLLSGRDGDDDKLNGLYVSGLQTVLDPAPNTANLVLMHHPIDWLEDAEDVDDAPAEHPAHLQGHLRPVSRQVRRQSGRAPRAASHSRADGRHGGDPCRSEQHAEGAAGGNALCRGQGVGAHRPNDRRADAAVPERWLPYLDRSRGRSFRGQMARWDQGEAGVRPAALHRPTLRGRASDDCPSSPRRTCFGEPTKQEQFCLTSLMRLDTSGAIILIMLGKIKQMADREGLAATCLKSITYASDAATCRR